MWFSFHHRPTPQFFLQPSNNLLPAIVISSHLEEKIINASFEEFKGRDTLFVSEWLRKNSARYVKANVNFMFCVINATINTLTERFLRDEKIHMLSSSVVYLSFAILNTFKNKKGVTKILVYSSVVVMDVILFAMVITSGLERFMKGAARVLIRLLQVPLRWHLQLIYCKMQF